MTQDFKVFMNSENKQCSKLSCKNSKFREYPISKVILKLLPVFALFITVHVALLVNFIHNNLILMCISIVGTGIFWTFVCLVSYDMYIQKHKGKRLYIRF